MVCAGIETATISGIEGILTYPLSCDHFFYLKFIIAIFIILAFVLWRVEEAQLKQPDMISILGVSAIATIFISVMGSLIGIITRDIMIYIVVGGSVFITIWFLKK